MIKHKIQMQRIELMVPMVLTVPVDPDHRLVYAEAVEMAVEILKHVSNAVFTELVTVPKKPATDK